MIGNKSKTLSDSNANTQSTPNKPSDATETEKSTLIEDFVYPTDELGVIFPYVKGVPIHEYLKGLNSVLGNPQLIKAATEAGDGRMVVFLDNERVVDTLIGQKGFQMNGKFITVNRLIPPSYRLIFSNVSPTIPNSALEFYLREELNLNLASTISILHLDPQDNLFGHVICGRRQVYVFDKLDEIRLPSSFILDYNDKSQRIFITTNKHICCKCQSRNHKPEDCDLEIDEVPLAVQQLSVFSTLTDATKENSDPLNPPAERATPVANCAQTDTSPSVAPSIEVVDTHVDEARCEATFSFRKENFSKIEGRVFSPPCIIRNLQWEILIMPRTDSKNGSKTLGFFVKCNGEPDNSSWSCNVRGQLTVVSQKEGVDNVVRKIEHLFNSKKDDWGFSNFMLWDDIVDPEKGFIKDDTVTFQAHVLADAPPDVSEDLW